MTSINFFMFLMSVKIKDLGTKPTKVYKQEVITNNTVPNTKTKLESN